MTDAPVIATPAPEEETHTRLRIKIRAYDHKIIDQSTKNHNRYGHPYRRHHQRASPVTNGKEQVHGDSVSFRP